jgi:hypothetical protein
MRDTLGSFGSIGLSAAQSWSVSLGFQHGLHAACRRPRLGPRLERVCFGTTPKSAGRRVRSR